MARKILFFTGKGGTGKSMLAAGFAISEAQKGRRVLLIELGESSFYQGVLTPQEPGFEPIEIKTNLFLSHWDGYSCLKDYIKYLVKSEALTKLIYENQFMKTLIEVGPSLSELAIIGKITSGVRRVGPPLNYDLIVVDAFASGHMLGMLRAPLGISDAIKFGPMATQCRDMISVLKNKDTTGYQIVSLPEELPTTESLELFDEIHLEIGVRPEFICNKLLDIAVSVEKLEDISKDNLVETEVKDFARFIQTKIEMQQKQVRRFSIGKTQVNTIPQILSNNMEDILNTIAESFSKASING